MIVDSHQHFWQVGRFDYPWMSPEVEVLYRDYLPPALAPVLNRNGVDKTIVVQASNSLEETRWLLSLTEHNAFIGGVVGWVDLTSADVARQLDEFAAHPKFKGVRHLVESEPADDWLTQPDTLNGLRELSSRGLSYDLLVHTRHLAHVKKVADECPELHLVVDHLAKPPVARAEIDEWAREIKEIASRPNVWCKLSGLVTEADFANWRVEDLQPYVEKVLEYFGPARLMFGSDWPVCLLAASYDQVLESFERLLAGLDEKDRRRVFSENAIEFYRIEEQAAVA
ncbi:MAG TPA: amidohydrolase family protein [Pyrinomonadaceae bacterium]|nr:amidohydrolase family protein [Pyrinomonadaceae bacterium]